MKTLIILSAFTFLLMISGSCRNDKKDAEFQIARGTNISHWLSQSDRRGSERLAWFTEDDVKYIAGLGFDHIRLPVDEEQLWDEEGNKEAEAFGLMHQAIGWSRDAGMRVVVDLHILRSHHFNLAEKPLWTDPAEQDKFVQLWKQLSEELSVYPDSLVAYELMNEAVADDPEDWNRLLARGIAAVRETEPNRKIVIGSNMWQSVSTFKDLNIPEDKNLILSFHFYNPFVFTHYTASWTPIGKYTGTVTYPGRVVDESQLEGLEPELRKMVEGSGGVYTIDSIRSQMSAPIEFAKAKGLPLYCGEWGALPSVPEDARLRWYTDMRQVLEEKGIAWANWDYKGSFGFFRKDGTPHDDLIRVLIK